MATERKATTRIYWTDQERELMKESLLEELQKSGIEMDHWTVTNRMLMKAQIEFIPEDRYRAFLGDPDVAEMQQRVDAYVQAHKTESIIKAHNIYLETHGMTPISHAHSLGKEIELLMKERDKLEANIILLEADVEHHIRVINGLRDDLTKVVGGKPLTHITPPPPPIKKKALPLFIGTARISSSCSDRLRRMSSDIVFLTSKDNAQSLKSKVQGRVAFGVEGQLTADLTRVIRENAMEFTNLRGGQSNLLTAVSERIDEFKATES